jgi:hypothetical protein
MGYNGSFSRQIVDYFLSVTIRLQPGKSVIRQLPGEVLGQMPYNGGHAPLSPSVGQPAEKMLEIPV